MIDVLSSDTREIQVVLDPLKLNTAALTVKDVAFHMQLSAKTISTYRTRLLDKMGLATNADLVRYVVEHDLMK